jgi:hypothetical protein
MLPLMQRPFPTATPCGTSPFHMSQRRVLGVLVFELAVARLHVPPGPCEHQYHGGSAVVPVSSADGVAG